LQRILISACLLGERVRYDGGDRHLESPLLMRWQQEGRLIALCPEVAGGLPVPRPPAEITGGDAEAVLRGRGAIRNNRGEDVTTPFLEGAERALACCLQHRIKLAILKEGSPSCAVAHLNDGSFSGRKIGGRGLTALLLARHGIATFNEHQLQEAADLPPQLEHPPHAVA